MVTNLAGMMVERLNLFKSTNANRLPQRIVVYRDGVSEVRLPVYIVLGG